MLPELKRLPIGHSFMSIFVYNTVCNLSSKDCNYCKNQKTSITDLLGITRIHDQLGFQEVCTNNNYGWDTDSQSCRWNLGWVHVVRYIESHLVLQKKTATRMTTTIPSLARGTQGCVVLLRVNLAIDNLSCKDGHTSKKS